MKPVAVKWTPPTFRQRVKRRADRWIDLCAQWLALSAEQETDLPPTTPTCAKCGALCEIIPTGWRCPKCEQEPT